MPRQATKRIQKAEKKRVRSRNDDKEEKAPVFDVEQARPTFISPEKTPRDVKSQHKKKQRQLTAITMRSPLQVHLDSHVRGATSTRDVHERVAVVRNALKHLAATYKEQVLRQVEEEHSHLYEKLSLEIRESEQQLHALKEANATINEKAERKIQSLTELAATEITSIEKAKSSALSNTTHLLNKEKQKVLQRFHSDVDALTA